MLDNIDFFSPSNMRQTLLGYMVQLSGNNFEMLSKNKLIIPVTKQLSTYLAVGLNAKAVGFMPFLNHLVIAGI